MMNTILFFTHIDTVRAGKRVVLLFKREELFYSSKTQKYLGCQEVQATVGIAVGAAALRSAFGVRLGAERYLRSSAMQYRRFWCKLGQLG